MAKRKQKPAASASSQRLMEAMYEVDALIQQERWHEAQALLEELELRYRYETQVFGRLAAVSSETGDTLAYERACERLYQLEPDEPEIARALASAYLENTRLALALGTLRALIERWPDDPFADEARQAIQVVENGLASMLGEFNLSLDDGMELAIQNDQMQSLMAKGSYHQAISLGENLIENFPRFSPAYHNLCQLYWLEGKINKAESTASKLLVYDPDNMYALADLVRFECVLGNLESAHHCTERLVSLDKSTPEHWVRLAEANTYLADDQGVLDAIQKVLSCDEIPQPADLALAYHLGAVAAMRLGRAEQAQKFWKQSLEAKPGFLFAESNLADLEKPQEKRHTPWAFTVQSWIPAKIVDEFLRLVQSGKSKTTDERLQRSLQSYLKRNLFLNELFPVLLKRGDESCRMFVLGLGRYASSPQLDQALCDFALGQDGPDDMRVEAAEIASRRGRLFSGEQTLWLQGKQQTVILLNFNIHADPPRKLPQAVEKLLEAAVAALRQGDGVQGENHLLEALELEPNLPELHNNLAVAYELQGRQDEAIALIEKLYERFPEYLYARTGMAQVFLRQGEVARAREALEPILRKKRIHIKEFDALCAAEIELHLTIKSINLAQSWFQVWESANPNNPQLDNFRYRIFDASEHVDDVREGN